MQDTNNDPGDAGADPVLRLVESFRALLDEALIVAIANDHDLRGSDGFNQAYTTLQGLAQSVPSEEATGFNPSGIPGLLEASGDGTKEDATTSSTSLSREASLARTTDLSSSESLASGAEPAYSPPRLTSFNDDSDEAKAHQLGSIFKDLKQFDVVYSLKKAQGDFQTALDDLLNVQYLQSTGQWVKGVDGFFQSELGSTSKGKKRNRNRPPATLAAEVQRDGSPLSGHIKESHAEDEIGHIADIFDLPSNEVSRLYFEANCSSGATALGLLDQYMSHGIKTQDEAGKKQAGDLARKYRQVPDQYMATIVQVAGSVSEFADDLAALLNRHFAKRRKSQKLDITHRLTPLPHEEIEGSASDASGLKPAASWIATPHTTGSPSDLTQALHASNRHSQARRDAATSAAQLHRRGASSPLYRQAAGYYADRARDQARYAQHATSAAADILVEQQSTLDVVDLHGVVVLDGVRIARQKTQAWWQNLGEFRSQKAKQQSLTIITGIGRHSAGGVSQLRQAVAAALLQDGWKIQVETGKFVVVGRR